jgi:hypothetical protein
MKLATFRPLAVAVCVSMTVPAFADAPALKLVPEPRIVRLGQDAFSTAAPHIFIEMENEREDRTAAATLVEELAARHVKATIIRTAPRARPPAGAVYLARLTGRPGLRARLAARGFAVTDKLDEEGYVIEVDAGGIVVAAETGAGLFYGVQTLRQLVTVDAHQRLTAPALQIEDYPAMRWRGVHDDISRGPIPTLDYMKEEVRTLSEYKLNLLALYMEDVFAFQSQPLVAPRDGALTAGDVKELVAYAARYHVTILPEQQTFGHLHQMLKLEAYADVAEKPNGSVLTPINPRTYDIIRDLYAELVPLFPGPFVHIGGDETAQLGKGQTRALVEKRGVARVYLEHLQHVAEILKPYGKRLMFWTDVAANYPESLSILPKDMIAVAWDYAPRPSYEPLLKPFKAAGMPLFVAPSAHNYRHPHPDFAGAFVNIRNFVRDGQRDEALGMLNTTWDDDGEELFDANWPAILFGAACAWQPGESSIERFQSRYDWAFYRADGTLFRDALAALAEVHALHVKAGVGLLDNADVHRDLFSPEGAIYVKHALPVAHELRLAAEHALENLYRGQRVAQLHVSTIDAMIFAALTFDTQGLRVEYAHDIASYYADAYQSQNDRPRVLADLAAISGVDGRLQDLRDLTSRLRDAYANLWRRENRPYLLQNVLAQYDVRLAQLTARINAIAAMSDAVLSKGVPLPSPAQLGFEKAP